jgi:30S ribosomal protein S31
MAERVSEKVELERHRDAAFRGCPGNGNSGTMWLPFTKENAIRRLEMGKGDQRSRRGKIYRGTFGKARPRKPKKKGKK